MLHAINVQSGVVCACVDCETWSIPFQRLRTNERTTLFLCVRTGWREKCPIPKRPDDKKYTVSDVHHTQTHTSISYTHDREKWDFHYQHHSASNPTYTILRENSTEWHSWVVCSNKIDKYTHFDQNLDPPQYSDRFDLEQRSVLRISDEDGVGP